LEVRVVPTLLGQQLFPLDNPWNQNISNAPVAANSAAIIANIGNSTHVTPNWYADNPADGSSPLYGMPINIVHGNSTAKVNVIIDNYPGESDVVPVPIPQNAVLEGDFQNGPNPNGAGYNANQRGDSDLIVWDEDNNIAYELYGVSRPTDPTLFPNSSNVELPHPDGQWHAAQETVWNLNTDTFRTLGETSASASGLSILAGLARPDEGLPVSQGGQGAIDHALSVTLPAADISPQYIYPASHMIPVSSGLDLLPLGSRLRLANTPAIDALISSMPPESQILATAMQQYGLIVSDVGPAMYVSGTSASVDANNNINLTWNLNDIFAANGLEALNAGDFQVVNLTPIVTGLSASSGPAGSTITITGQNFSGAAGHLSVLFGSAPSSSVNVLGDTEITALVPNGTGTVDVTVQSGVSETDNLSSNPNANVNAPIFGYGTSATTPADLFTFTTLPSFANLSAPTITYGTASTTVSGRLQSNTTQPVPAGEMVQITLNGVTQDATLDGSDNFFTIFNTSTFGVASSPYTVSFAYAGDTNFQSASAGTTLTVHKATPTFSNLSAPSITAGTASTIISGHLNANAGSQIVPSGEMVQVTLNGVTHNAKLDGSDNFSTTFNTSTLPVAGSPYAIGFAYAGDANFTTAAPGSSSLTVKPAPTAPTVLSTVVNNGAVQRSMVQTLTVTFSDIVNIAAGAFKISRTYGTAVNLSFTTSIVHGDTVATITFQGGSAATYKLANGTYALKDGNYTLTIDHTKVTDASSSLQLNGNGSGGNYTFGPSAGFYRLFGDLYGQRKVNTQDLTDMLLALGSSTGSSRYNSALDYHGTGTITLADLFQLLKRLGTKLKP
jgi:hypothetical protein